MEKLMAEYCDKVLSHVAKHRSAVTYTKELEELISADDWRKAIEEISATTNYINRMSSNVYSIQITSFGRAFLADGESFNKLAIEAEAEKNKERKRQDEIDRKRGLDIEYTERQQKTYWWIFGIAVLSLVLNFILAIDKLTTKPVIQKEYLLIDSRGRTISP
jgi:hypothetical protein